MVSPPGWLWPARLDRGLASDALESRAREQRSGANLDRLPLGRRRCARPASFRGRHAEVAPSPLAPEYRWTYCGNFEVVQALSTVPGASREAAGDRLGSQRAPL